MFYPLSELRVEHLAARARELGAPTQTETELDITHTRKVDVRLPGKGNSNSHGARPVHLIITTIKWIRTSRLSIKNSLHGREADRVEHLAVDVPVGMPTPEISHTG